MCRPFSFEPLSREAFRGRYALSLLVFVFGEGRVEFFLRLLAPLADATRPRFRAATLAEGGRDIYSFSFFRRCPSVRRRSALSLMKPAASRWS